MEVNHLTPAEWNLMECLWEHSPRTGREAVEHLQVSAGWSRSTTLTQLRRMTEKGFIRADEKDGLTVYYPMIPRQEAVLQETDSFLQRVYNGSVGLLVSALTQKQALTQAEIDELYAILQDAEEANKNA